MLSILDLTSNVDITPNITSTDYLVSEVDLNPHDLQSPVTWGLAGFIATVISFLAYLSWSTKVDERSPQFTSDKILFTSSWRFSTHKT